MKNLSVCKNCRWELFCTNKCSEKSKSNCAYHTSKNNKEYDKDKLSLYEFFSISKFICSYYSQYEKNIGCHRKGVLEEFKICPFMKKGHCPRDFAEESFNSEEVLEILEDWWDDYKFNQTLKFFKAKNKNLESGL